MAVATGVGVGVAVATGVGVGVAVATGVSVGMAVATESISPTRVNGKEEDILRDSRGGEPKQQQWRNKMLHLWYWSRNARATVDDNM